MSDRPHVVYISYNGLSEPLGASQVLPDLHVLSDRWRFTVLSFEKTNGPMARSPEEIEEELQADGNRWVRLRYHRELGLASKLWDIGAGTRAARRVLSRDPAALLHARGYLPAAIAARAAGKLPFLFDIRGLQAEESVDAGTWRRHGLNYALTKAAERRLFSRAAGVVTLTEAIIPYLREQPGMVGREIPWEVIPCCVDLSHFRFDERHRHRVRSELGLDDRDEVFVWIGSIGTWYAFEAALQLVAARPQGFLLMLSSTSQSEIEKLCDDVRFPRSRLALRFATRTEIPEFLSAADWALSLVRPSPSKRASSPTKIAEAFASGLPVIAYRGVGDLDTLAKTDDSGSILLIDPSQPSIAETASRPDRNGPRAIAESRFSLEVGSERYDRLYRRLRNAE